LGEDLKGEDQRRSMCVIVLYILMHESLLLNQILVSFNCLMFVLYVVLERVCVCLWFPLYWVVFVNSSLLWLLWFFFLPWR